MQRTELNQQLTVFSVSCLSDLPSVLTLTLIVEWRRGVSDTTVLYVNTQLHTQTAWDFTSQFTQERGHSPVPTVPTDLLNEDIWIVTLPPTIAVSCPLMFLVRWFCQRLSVFITPSYIVQEKNCYSVLTVSTRLLKRLIWPDMSKSDTVLMVSIGLLFYLW